MRSPEQEDRAMDSAVLTLLLDDRFDVWALAEIERAIGDPVAAADSLRRLQGGGLVHRFTNDFFMATRPAVYCSQLDLA